MSEAPSTPVTPEDVQSTEKTPIDRRLQNLRPPFRPGQSGNPKGYPKGRTHIQSMLLRYGKLKAPEAFAQKVRAAFPELKNKDLTLDMLTWLQVAMRAGNGDLDCTKFLAERLEGKAAQTVVLDGNLNTNQDRFSDEERAALADALDRVRGAHGDSDGSAS